MDTKYFFAFLSIWYFYDSFSDFRITLGLYLPLFYCIFLCNSNYASMLNIKKTPTIAMCNCKKYLHLFLMVKQWDWWIYFKKNRFYKLVLLCQKYGRNYRAIRPKKLLPISVIGAKKSMVSPSVPSLKIRSYF